MHIYDVCSAVILVSLVIIATIAAPAGVIIPAVIGNRMLFTTAAPLILNPFMVLLVSCLLDWVYTLKSTTSFIHYRLLLTN